MKVATLYLFYHSSPYKIDSFIPGDVGIHFGSYIQSINRAKGKNFEDPSVEDFYIYRGYGVLENPIEVDDDPFQWTAIQYIQALNKGVH